MKIDPVPTPHSPSLHVVLVEPEIHWNTGNIGRTCLAVGAQLHLVKPLGFSLHEKAVRRAGLDYWKHVHPIVWDDFAKFEEEIPNLGAPYFFTPEAPRTLWDAQYAPRSVLVFGRESSGFAAEVRERHRAFTYSIPVTDDSVRSLNLSNCVSIVSYEVLRQRIAAPS